MLSGVGRTVTRLVVAVLVGGTAVACGSGSGEAERTERDLRAMPGVVSAAIRHDSSYTQGVTFEQRIVLRPDVLPVQLDAVVQRVAAARRDPALVKASGHTLIRLGTDPDFFTPGGGDRLDITWPQDPGVEAEPTLGAAVRAWLRLAAGHEAHSHIDIRPAGASVVGLTISARADGGPAALAAAWSALGALDPVPGARMRAGVTMGPPDQGGRPRLVTSADSLRPPEPVLQAMSATAAVSATIGEPDGTVVALQWTAERVLKGSVTLRVPADDRTTARPDPTTSTTARYAARYRAALASSGLPYRLEVMFSDELFAEFDGGP